MMPSDVEDSADSATKRQRDQWTDHRKTTRAGVLRHGTPLFSGIESLLGHDESPTRPPSDPQIQSGLKHEDDGRTSPFPRRAFNPRSPLKACNRERGLGG